MAQREGRERWTPYGWPGSTPKHGTARQLVAAGLLAADHALVEDAHAEDLDRFGYRF